MNLKMKEPAISQQEFLQLLQQCEVEGKETKDVKVETFVQSISEKLQVLYGRKTAE